MHLLGISDFAVFSIGNVFWELCQKNDTIKILNQEYTRFDTYESDFIPFGSYNCWYDDDISYRTFLGLSFVKNDINKNFIYRQTTLGTTVFKKNTYSLPEFPGGDIIDKLILSYKDEHIVLDNTDDINAIIDFLSTFETTGDINNENAVVFYAISNNAGGIFQLNRYGSIYVKDDGTIGCGRIIQSELPMEIQKIIQKIIL